VSLSSPQVSLRAINVRTNHVHTVVSAVSDRSDTDAFKSYSTRALEGLGFSISESSRGLVTVVRSIFGKSVMSRRLLNMCLLDKMVITAV